MRPLTEGVSPSGHTWQRTRLIEYLVPSVARDDDAEPLRWSSLAWRPWWRGWLPGHLLAWVEAVEMAAAIRQGQTLGAWWVVPQGYRCDVSRQQPRDTGDPFQQEETIGITFRPRRDTQEPGQHDRDPHTGEESHGRPD